MSIRPVVVAATLSALALGACSRTGLPRTAEHGAAGDGTPATMASGTGGGGGATMATTTSAGGATPDAAATATVDGAPPVAATVDCFIATRTDTCCRYPFPASRHEMDEDPCVQSYWTPTVRPECVARRPAGCATVDCALVLPPSRVVGRGPTSGNCEYLSECQTAEDCLWVIDIRQCCGCPAYMPRALVEADPCLQDPANTSSAVCPNDLCASVRCDNPDVYCPRASVACTSDALAAGGLRGCVDQIP